MRTLEFCIRPDSLMSRSIVLRRSPIHGNGLFAARNLPAGQRLIEYRGQRLTHAQADRGHSHDVESGHTFLFTLNDDYVIDGSLQGNSARWINHSCAPNCEAVLEEAPGNPRADRVFIESIRPIKAGEELSYDYGIILSDTRHTARMKKLWPCRCGSHKCTGTLLKPKKRA